MQEFIDKYYTKDGKLFRKFDNKEKYKDVH